MDAVGTGTLDDVQDGLGVQVALRSGLAAEGVGLIGEADVHGVSIEFGVDGDRLDAHLATRPNDSDRDLSSVSDKDLLQHGIPSS